LDCQANQAYFYASQDADFAIREYGYVPVRESADGEQYRDQSLEDWFSQGENDFSLITDRILAGEPSRVPAGAYGGFLQAAILLGFRSRYEYTCVEQELKNRRPGLTDEERSRLVIDAFKALYSAKLHQFKHWDYMLISNLSEPLLVCDRPLFDMTVSSAPDDCVFLPLAPDLLLVGTPPQDPARNSATFELAKGGNLARQANEMTVERAREFLVGTKAQLVALMPRFTAEKFQERKARDQFRASITLRVPPKGGGAGGVPPGGS
jgi:hypothetical protein